MNSAEGNTQEMGLGKPETKAGGGAERDARQILLHTAVQVK